MRLGEGYAPGSPEYRRVQAALLCLGIAMFAQLYAPQGVLVQVASALSVTPDQAALLISTATGGLAVGVLPWAGVADRIGRLPAMRIAILAASACGIGVLVWPSYPGVLVMRVLQGLALGGVPALALTYLQEEIHPAHAARAAGTYVAGTTLGGMLGRLLAASVGDVAGWRFGLAAVEAASVAAAVGFLLLAPSARGFARPLPAERIPVAELLRHHLLTPPMLILYAQGFALMGAFVSVYNYLAFRLEAPPFSLPAAVTALLFLAYFAGTWSSRRAGALAARMGRLRVFGAGAAIIALGLLLLLTAWLWAIVIGLIVMTIGFFAAHAVAAGWTTARASAGRAQAASLYNLCYYLGSSVVGWVGGVVFAGLGWAALLLGLIALIVLAATSAVVVLRRPSPPPPRRAPSTM